jgi:glucokinase
MTEMQEWVLADASTSGHVRFATARAGDLLLHDVRTISSAAYPTFTDTLLAYVTERGGDARRLGCVLAVAAPPVGDSIRIARSRWTISRSGLGAVFGGPVTVLNDVAATVWSLLGAQPGPIQRMAGAAPDFARPGRWAVVLLDDGVAAAALAIDADGHATVIDGEFGHTGFSPADAGEFALMQRLRDHRPGVSWERVLTEGGIGDDLDWAGLAGAFAGDAMLALGAWDGLFVCGRRTASLRAIDRQMRFAARLAAKGDYGRHLGVAGRALMLARDPLAGCLALVNRRAGAAALSVERLAG